MITYLKGQPITTVKNLSNRILLILEVNQVGYEVQIPTRFALQVEADSQTPIQVYTHLQIKDDRQLLYGFSTAAERDLFRHLIGVSGIGSQLAIALIDTLGLEELVQAIVTANIRLLSKTPGVGQKTAERISLELKTKLAQWRQVAGVTIAPTAAIPENEILEDLEMTLVALGYTNEEIIQVISVLSQDNLLLKNPDVEEWIRRAIAYLSQG